MKLSQKQIKYLKGLAHHLKPVVMVGKEGVSPAVSKELSATLACHELIKVRVSADEREDFKALVAELGEKTDAALVQTIGRMAIFYKAALASDEERKRARICLPSA